MIPPRAPPAPAPIAPPLKVLEVLHPKENTRINKKIEALLTL
jgi:hypothetical protein